MSFKEIYNKHRTRFITELIPHDKLYETTPKVDYVEDNNGTFIKTKQYGFICYPYWQDTYDALYLDGQFYKVSIADLHKNPIKHFKQIPYKGEPQYTTLTEYSREGRDVRDTNIVGTALAITSTLLEFIACGKITWNWFKGKITDGYAMVLLSPFILTYWALVSVAYVPLVGFLSALVAGAFIYTPIFEFPAGWMNKEKNQYLQKD